VLTSGATASLKLVGECFPWQRGSSCFAYTLANHNSVLGIRELALSAGAVVQAVQLGSSHAGVGPAGAAVQAVQLATASAGVGPAGPGGVAAVPAGAEVDPEASVAHGAISSASASASPGYSLLAMPLECNFSGARYRPAAVLAALQRSPAGAGRRWLLLLDAAKACATHPPDLAGACAGADMVALSYYKVGPAGRGGGFLSRAPAAGRCACGTPKHPAMWYWLSRCWAVGCAARRRCPFSL
jgi:molybdenum cofactor sulfurtransferase